MNILPHTFMLLEINFQTFTGSDSVIFCPVILGLLFQNLKIFKHFASTTVIVFPVSFTSSSVLTRIPFVSSMQSLIRSLNRMRPKMQRALQIM